MNQRTRTGLEILQVAAVLGVLGDVLLRVTPWGLNVLLFNVAFAAGMAMLLWRKAPQHLTRQTILLLGALVFFASMFVWRDSIELRVADTAAILAILSALFLSRMKVAARVAGVFHYVIAFIGAAFNALLAPFAILVADIDWKIIPSSGGLKYLFSVIRGVAIALPLILIFGGLFVAADSVYEGWVQHIFNIAPETLEQLFSHLLLFSIFAWLSAGFLRGVLIEGLDLAPSTSRYGEGKTHGASLPNDLSILEHINISDEPNADKTAKEEKKAWRWDELDNTMLPPFLTLGSVEIGVVLGLVNLLFLSFVLVQVPYLFGGMELVQNTPDFKLAEYARRGFGELVAVSALVLPILLVSHWLIRKDEPLAGILFRIFAGVQLALLFVIMASAAQRLFLLTGNLGYGLTTVRLYPMIFMGWLAIVFVWFALTVLRGARQHFAWGALWLAFLVLGSTHVLNPDEFIVRTNIKLASEGRDFDAHYNSGLSDDALPALLDSLANINEHDQASVAALLASRYCQKLEETDPRSWNYSRWTAHQKLLSDQAFISEIGECHDLHSRLGLPVQESEHDH